MKAYTITIIDPTLLTAIEPSEQVWAATAKEAAAKHIRMSPDKLTALNTGPSAYDRPRYFARDVNRHGEEESFILFVEPA